MVYDCMGGAPYYGVIASSARAWKNQLEARGGLGGRDLLVGFGLDGLGRAEVETLAVRVRLGWRRWFESGWRGWRCNGLGGVGGGWGRWRCSLMAGGSTHTIVHTQK